MNTFSEVSLERLNSCHPALQKLAHHVLREMDISIIEGWRSPERQLQLHEDNLTKVLVSKHNHRLELPSGEKVPWSLAMDIAPYPVDFGKTPKQILQLYVDKVMDAETIALLEREFIKASITMARFYYLGALVRKTAEVLNITIRWGGDWDSDTDFFDQTFNDLVHFELVGYEQHPHDDGSYQIGEPRRA